MLVNYKDETLDKKEAYMKNRYEPIKFADDSLKIKSLWDLFYNLFVKQKQTNYASTNQLHCTRNRGRSYIDAYLLCMHYFPEISYREMYNTLKEYIRDRWEHSEDGYLPEFWVCNTIGRNRFSGTMTQPKNRNLKKKLNAKRNDKRVAIQ